MDGLNLVEFAKQHPSLRRKIAVGSGLCAILLAAEYYGLVSDACKWLRRGLSTVVAAWLEEQGGFPLFTLEGEEPDVAKLSWDLPSMVARGAADASRQLGGEGPGQEVHAEIPSPASSSAAELPNFFASTKFFSCLDLKESQELFEASQMVTVAPHETLFEVGESGHPGIFIVVEGQLGVFIPQGEQLKHSNTLRAGESCGDFDVLDGASRSVTCVALEEGAVLVQVSRALFMRFIAAKPRTLQIYLHKAMARLWRVGHFVLSDFLNLTLDQASSTHLSETPHLSSMAQLSMPDSAAQRPMKQAMAQSELDCMRTSNAGKPKQAISPREKARPRQATAAGGVRRNRMEGEEAKGSGDGSLQGEGSREGPAESLEAAFEAESGGAQKPETKGSASRPSPPASPASSSGGDADPLEGQEVKEGHNPAAAAKGSAPVKLPVPRSGDPRASSTGRGQKMVKFHPSLAAVKESSSERRPTSAGSPGAPFVQPSREGSPKEKEAEVTAGVPLAKPRKSMLTEIIRKGDLNPSAVSPFASVSQQSSPTTSTLDLSPAPSSKSSLGDELVRLGEEHGDEMLAKSEETEIASSIRNAMSHLRAGSLPAALVRPIFAENDDDSDVQGKSPDAGGEGEAAMEGRAQLSNPVRSAGQACLSMGWDVISPEECCLSSRLWRKLFVEAGKKGAGLRVDLRRGEVLHVKDQPCRRFQIVLEGRLLAERKGREGQQESVQVTPGSLIGCAAFLSSSRNRETIRVSQTTSLAMFGPQELDALMKRASDCFVELLLAAARALGPVIRRFISLGLNRVWLDAGNAAYRQGENASCLYIIISGRLRLVREDPNARPSVRVEEEVGRGEAVGAVWALAGGYHDTSALCVRDAELVRMSRGAFELIVAQCPMAVAGMLSGMGRRLAAASAIRSYGSKYDPTGRAAVATPVPATSKLNGAAGGGTAKRGEVVTICLVPAGCKPGRGMECADGSATAIKKLGEALRHTLEELFGPTLHLSSASMELTFPTSFHRLSTIFYRSKVTSWMAAQEEDYRFILMEADSNVSAWTRICVSQADCLLLVGAEGSVAPVNEIEHHLIWEAMGPMLKKDSLGMMTNKLAEGPPPQSSQGYVDAKLYAARMRRVELVLLHSQESEPQGTIHWLKARPHLARHHHARISHPKDMARLARWMAGKAVGLVLSGGGSRGLAHLGVLHALDDAGVPVDVIGGTSQGAFMAALYAQGLTWEQMHRTVRSYATQMGSVRHLIWDLTLPIISVFNGHGFDRVIRDSFSIGPQQIEDLWLSYFCITTNLSQAEPSVHQRGLLWKLVRASMTIVGLVPPVYYKGDLLVDGGYLNNIPVDVMRGGLGVDTVIVVDVEDKDASVWRNLTSYEGGISGWRLLWDRWCPIPSLRYGFKIPRYQQIVNHLSWMSHSQNLKRVSREHVIDLYLQPPVGKFRLMDFHHLERLVRDANRYAFGAIAEWQCRQGVSQQGMAGTRPLKETAKLRMRRAHSIPCMTQLQIKQSDAYSGEASDEQDPHRAETLRVSDSTEASDALAQMVAAGEASSSSNWPSGNAGDAKPSGLFQIVGPMAFPSATDLSVLEEGPATKASIQSLPSRRLAASSPKLSMQAGDFGGRRPSLEAQLRPIDSKTIRKWLPSGSKSRLSKEDELPDIDDFPVTTPQLSTSAPPAPAAPWAADIGEGSLALPNQAILPEDSRPRRVLPEVRRPSFRAHSSTQLGEDARAIEGLTSRPSFRDKS